MSRTMRRIVTSAAVFLGVLMGFNAAPSGQSLGAPRGTCPVAVPASVLAQIKDPTARSAAQTVSLTPEFIASNGGAAVMIAQLQQQIAETDSAIAQEEAQQRAYPGTLLGVTLAERQRTLQAMRDSRVLSVAMIDMLRCTQSSPTMPGGVRGAMDQQTGRRLTEEEAIRAKCGALLGKENTTGLPENDYRVCRENVRSSFDYDSASSNWTSPASPIATAPQLIEQQRARQAAANAAAAAGTGTPDSVPFFGTVPRPASGVPGDLRGVVSRDPSGIDRVLDDVLSGANGGSCTATVSFEEVNRVGNVVSFKMRVRHNGPENSRVQFGVRASDSGGQGFDAMSWDSEVPVDDLVSPRTVSVPFAQPLSNEEQTMCANLPAFRAKLQQEREAIVRRVDGLRAELRRLDEHRASLENIESLAGLAQWTVGAKATLDTIKNVLSTAVPALKPAECGTVALADFAFSIPQWCRTDVKDSFVKSCADGLSDAVVKAGAAGLACANLPVADHLVNATSLLKDLGEIAEAADAKTYARDMLDDLTTALRQHRATVDDLARNTREIDAAVDALNNLCTTQQRQNAAPVSLDAIGVSCTVPAALRMQ